MNTSIEYARFDARLTKEQKSLFEEAALLGGFRSLTDFIVSTAQEKAREIIKQKELILASERDKEIFFEALMNPKPPSEKLKQAFSDYNAYLSERK